MGITVPGPAEILRSSQRDTAFIQKLTDDINEVVQLALGQRNWLQWRKWTDYYIPASLYYALTNLSGNQTLGEEHAGILQVDASGRNVPSKLTIATMVILQIFGRAALDSGLAKLELFLEKKPDDHNVILNQGMTTSGGTTTQTLYVPSCSSSCNGTDWCSIWLTCWVKLIKVVHSSLPFFSQVHLAYFFFQKTFYDISKRVTNINYILLRKYFANTNPASQQNLRYLMWMSLVNLFLAIIHHTINYVKSNRLRNSSLTSTVHKAAKPKRVDSKPLIDDPMKKCSLCLETRNYPSVTPCGHIFCWQCIIQWLSTKQECPICRENVLPSRVIPLRNYN